MRRIRPGFVLLMCLFLGMSASANSISDSLNLYIQGLKEKAISENNKAELAAINKQIGVNYQRLQAYDSAINYYQKALVFASKARLDDLKSSLWYNLGLTYRLKSEYQAAMVYAEQALEADKVLGDTNSMTASLNLVALIYQDWGNYEKALEFRIQALELSELSANQIEVANSTYNLGNLYLKLGKQDKAKENFIASHDAFENLLQLTPNDENLKLGLSETLYSLAGIYMAEGDLDKAQQEYSKALILKKAISDKVGMGTCMQQIGLVKLQQKDYDGARQTFFSALGLKNAVGDKKGVALINFYIANLYFEQLQFVESKAFINRSLLVAKAIGDKELLRENFNLLYLIDRAQNKHKDALLNHELFKAYADSVLNENTTKVVEELNVRYETDKKEKENQLLTQENEINTLTIEKQKAVGRYLVGIIVSVLVILAILYKLFQSKKKSHKLIEHKNHLLGEQNTQIEKQKKVIERKNRDMTDSIVYARRIQESMLTNVVKLNSLLSEAFIYFKPKDIVSGDFYWFGEKDGKIIISAIDCTGHGVPGAFMSMLGNTFLNQIVFNMGITSPKDILLELSKEVQIALKQEETKNRDGMDMALCTIDLKNKMVEFSGAKNPLVLVKNGEVQRIKGDKAPIGLSYGENTAFTNHQIPLDSTSQFYMFSDGYADQFGGPDNKKFMIKRFQQLLFDNHDKPMAEQQHILSDKMDEWMGNGEQIDDILVVGFKLSV